MGQDHIVISGYFGFGNAGDEAILNAMVTSFRHAMPDLRITVLSPNPRPVQSRLPITILSRGDILKTLQAYASCNLFISGGGGLLQDTTGVRTIQYYLGMVSIARMFRKPVLFYAQGIGPVSTEQGKALVRKVVNLVQVVTVRDEPSRRLLNELGVNRPPIYVTADPVLGHEPAPAARIDELMAAENIAAQGLKLGVSVRPWKDPPTPVDTIAHALRTIGDEFDAQLVLFPFQHSEDFAMSQALAEKIGPRARFVKGQYDTPELQGLIGRMDAVVAMRLHCHIFAATQFVPMLGLSYDPKVRQFLDLVSSPYIPLHEVALDRLLADVRSLLQDRDAGRARLQECVPPLRQRALETTRYVQELLQRRGQRPIP